MKILQVVLANLIRNGKVIVETPELDMDELKRAVQNRAEETLREIEGIVFEEELSDREKVAWIQARLEE